MVYELSDYLINHPDEVAEVQALTLNEGKPYLGLRGNKGLYGSNDWWLNIENGKIPLDYVEGIVCDVYFSGQDAPDGFNTVDVKCHDGSVRPVGLVLLNFSDESYFKIGAFVCAVYVLDETKHQPGFGGGVGYADILLELAVSVD